MNDLPESASETAPLVNEIALKDCLVRSGDAAARVLDISHVRLVIERAEPWASQPEDQLLPTDFSLDRSRFSAAVAVRPGGTPDRLRLGFERLVPSARSALRAFLSPKKVGESIRQCRPPVAGDVAASRWRRYHGLNESELWFDPDGGVLFTYLDAADVDVAYHFVVQLADHRSPLRVGRMLRRDYLALTSAEAEVALLPLTDREAYAKLGECRDIITNFRPSAPAEYVLKQRLLRALSETMYSTSHKVDMAAGRPAAASASAPPMESPKS